MNTHNVLITKIPSGEVFQADFPSLLAAEAWRDKLVKIHDLDFIGGHHYFPRSGPYSDPVVDPNPNATCVLSEIDNRPALIQILLASADAFAVAKVDRNEREQFLGWIVTPGTSPAKLAKIAAVQAWLTSIWNEHYYPLKARILAGDLTAVWDDNAVAPLPYTFYEIATTV